MKRTLRVVGSLSASVLAATGCKETPKASKQNYPIVDERGDLPVVGSLAGNLQSPFYTEAFDDKTCLTQQNSGSVQNVSVRMNVDEVAEDLSKPRTSTQQVVDIDAGLVFNQGRLASPWFDPFSSSLGEVSDAKIDLDVFEKKDDGISAAHLLIENENYKKNITAPAKQFMPCDLIKDGRLDLTTGSSRVNAAFGVAAILGREVKFLETHAAAGSPLFPKNFQVSRFGLNVLGEQQVDYSFVAPNSQGVKTRFYQRFAAVDNMSFAVRNTYSESFSGSSFRAVRKFVVLPHSSFFANDFLSAGAFYKTPFGLQHEFGHLIFSESVRRDISVTLAETAFSFAKAAMFVPKVLLGLERDRMHIEMREIRGDGGRHDAEVAIKEFHLLDGTNSKNLTGAERAELARRVDYVFRAIEEAYADFYALARSGHYGGFRMGCIGTDRDPRVDSFGVGTSFQQAKRIPAEIHLTDYLSDENSWKAQATGSERVLLSDRNECTGKPQTLQRAYVLAGILTNWLHVGVTELFSKRFSELDEVARVDFVLASIEALQGVWSPWNTMVAAGFQQGKFLNFTDGLSDAALLDTVGQVSMQKSLSAVLDKIFSADATGWYTRYRPVSGLSPTAGRARFCELAKERGLMASCP